MFTVDDIFEPDSWASPSTEGGRAAALSRLLLMSQFLENVGVFGKRVCVCGMNVCMGTCVCVSERQEVTKSGAFLRRKAALVGQESP